MGDVLSQNNSVVEESEGTRTTDPDQPGTVDRSRRSLDVDSQKEFQQPVKAVMEELQEGLEGVLYRSVARGETDRRSGIDLWVLVAENRAEAQRRVNQLELDLEEETFDVS